MTVKVYKQNIKCSFCGEMTTTQTAFGRWIHDHPDLDSIYEGFVTQDLDIFVHKYKNNYEREVECIMLIEVKTFGKKPDICQRDTLSIIGQFLRNRKPTNYKRMRMQLSATEMKAYSRLKNKYVKVRGFGYHLLQFEKDNPENGWIKWDNKLINKKMLIKILRFEVDPDTLNGFDLRKHHKKHKTLFSLTSP